MTGWLDEASGWLNSVAGVDHAGHDNGRGEGRDNGQDDGRDNGRDEGLS